MNPTTKSQNAKITRIREYFTKRNHGRDLARFEIEKTEYGTIYVYIQTTDNVFTMLGGIFSITKRGLVKCLMDYNLGKKSESHYEKMFRG